MSSGKALFQLSGREQAERTIETLTKTALVELPGVEVGGAVQACDGLSCDEAVHYLVGRGEQEANMSPLKPVKMLARDTRRSPRI